MFCRFFTMSSKCFAHDAVTRPHEAKNGVKNHTHEQTVNAQKRAIFRLIYIYIDNTALDWEGFLWYHMGVKLGCFVAVLHEFDLVLPRPPMPTRVPERAFRGETRKVAVCKQKNSAYPAELFAVSALSWSACAASAPHLLPAERLIEIKSRNGGCAGGKERLSLWYVAHSGLPPEGIAPAMGHG